MKGKKKKSKHPTSKFPIPTEKDLSPLLKAIDKEIKYLDMAIEGAQWERDDDNASVGTLILRMICPRCGVRAPVILSILMNDPKVLPKFEGLAKTAVRQIYSWYERAHHVVADAQRALAGPKTAPKPPAPVVDLSAVRAAKPSKTKTK